MVKLFSELVKRERILSTGLGARAMADMWEGRGSTLRRAQGSPTARHVWQALDVGLDSFAL